MNYVCSQLSTPDAAGVQSCVSWVQQPDFFPDLSAANVADLTAAFALFIAVAAIFKLLRRSL